MLTEKKREATYLLSRGEKDDSIGYLPPLLPYDFVQSAERPS
jgi:hypothetical protein